MGFDDGRPLKEGIVHDWTRVWGRSCLALPFEHQGFWVHCHQRSGIPLTTLISGILACDVMPDLQRGFLPSAK